MFRNPKLEDALSTFLDSTGVDRGGLARLGPASKPPPPTPAAMQLLLANLEVASRQSRLMVWMRVGLIFGIFILAAGFAVYYRNNATFVAGAILGGSGVMAFLLQQMQGAHAGIVSTQILIALLPSVPSEEWAKYVGILMDEVLKTPKPSKPGK